MRIAHQPTALQRYTGVAVHAKTLTHHDISGPDSGIGVANGVGEAHRNVVIPVRKKARCLRGRSGFGIDDGW